MTDITPEDQFVLLACDGLFDVYPDERDLVHFIRDYMLQHGDPHKCCQVSSSYVACWYDCVVTADGYIMYM